MRHILILSLFLFSCSVFNPLGDNSQAKTYLLKLALKSEISKGYKIVRKWDRDLKVYFHFDTNETIIDEFYQIAFELNNLSRSVKVSRTDEIEEANVNVYNVTPSEAKDIYNGLKAKDFIGYVSVRFNTKTGVIQDARIFINSNIKDEVLIKHAIREELIQAYGLLNDTGQYRQSIFYEGYSNVITYSKIDTEVFRLYSDPKIKPRMNAKELKAVLKEM